jgi:hypothetical protein
MRMLLFLLTGLLAWSACSSPEEAQSASVAVRFSHNWENTPVNAADFNILKFTNENGEMLSIERLRYLVSNVILTSASNEIYKLSSYQLVNLGEEKVTIEGNEVPAGDYKLSFVFGFTDTENVDGSYPDLNTASFNVPGMLGGGYHFMQFDGKYVGQSLAPAAFNYHVVSAVNSADPNNLIFQDTSFKVDLGVVSISATTEIEIKMNIAEWFKNPNTWDLNVLNTVLMPNFDAQILMHQNGKSVFSLGAVQE